MGKGRYTAFDIIMAVCQKELVDICMRLDEICCSFVVVMCAFKSQSGNIPGWLHTYTHISKIGQGVLPYVHVALKYRIRSHFFFIYFVLQNRRLIFSGF